MASSTANMRRSAGRFACGPLLRQAAVSSSVFSRCRPVSSSRLQACRATAEASSCASSASAIGAHGARAVRAAASRSKAGLPQRREVERRGSRLAPCRCCRRTARRNVADHGPVPRVQLRPRSVAHIGEAQRPRRCVRASTASAGRLCVCASSEHLHAVLHAPQELVGRGQSSAPRRPAAACAPASRGSTVSSEGCAQRADPGRRAPAGRPAR